MSPKKNKYVKKSMISEMLFGEEKYVEEFSQASIQSFKEFSDNYANSLLDRDLESLRKAGHKIKPVAQMLNLQPILDEYEEAKVMLEEEESDAELQSSAAKIEKLCKQIINDFTEIINEIK